MSDNGGGVVVPKEPTEERLRAMSEALDPVIMGGFNHHKSRLRAAYKAMLSAAPASAPHEVVGEIDALYAKATHPPYVAGDFVYDALRGAVHHRDFYLIKALVNRWPEIRALLNSLPMDDKDENNGG